MLEKLKHTFALSDQGAKDMVKAFLACILHNISLMVPVVLLYSLVNDLLGGGIPGRKGMFYIVGIVVALGIIFFTCYIQYNATFFATYVESGVRRLTLAEKLRKIPLSFFGKKDLTDLTNIMMGDCASLESGLSHWVPELIGSVFSTLLIAIGIFFFQLENGSCLFVGTSCFLWHPVSYFWNYGKDREEGAESKAVQRRWDTGVPGNYKGFES